MIIEDDFFGLMETNTRIINLNQYDDSNGFYRVLVLAIIPGFTCTVFIILMS